MTLQRTEAVLTRIKGLGAVAGLMLAAIGGAAFGMTRAPFALVVATGLAAAAIAFWFERASLVTPETRARGDFPVILAAGLAMFAVLGVGLTALATLLATWWLPRL